MGLDVSHDAWSGPYSAFMSWRIALQKAAGWHPIEDYNEWYGVDTHVINWDAVTDENIGGEWEAVPEDPLIVLIAHSDCDGTIPVPALAPLADRLEGLLDKFVDNGPPGHPRPRPERWPEDEPWPPHRAHYDGYRAATERFITGLRAAASAGEPLEFG